MDSRLFWLPILTFIFLFIPINLQNDLEKAFSVANQKQVLFILSSTQAIHLLIQNVLKDLCTFILH